MTGLVREVRQAASVLHRRSLASVGRDESGATALEFAIIAPVFLALLMSFYDLGMIMLRQVLLQSAVERSVRELRVDLAEAQREQRNRTISRADFKAKVCDRSLILFDCEDTIRLEATALGRYGTGTLTSDVCEDSGGTDLEVGGTNDIVVLRVCAVANPLMPTLGLGKALTRDEDDNVRISSTTAYMNE